MKCKDCKGTGKYQPLYGPPEPCQACADTNISDKDKVVIQSEPQYLLGTSVSRLAAESAAMTRRAKSLAACFRGLPPKGLTRNQYQLWVKAQTACSELNRSAVRVRKLSDLIRKARTS